MSAALPVREDTRAQSANGLEYQVQCNVTGWALLTMVYADNVCHTCHGVWPLI